MIIATKLHIPRPRAPFVARTRLIHRLDEGLSRELTLITAPAGYGKTTLLSEWTATLHHPVAWVSLDQRDNDPARFWSHTIAALKQAYPDFDEQAVLRHAAEDPAGDALIAALVNGLHRVSQSKVLVWDDFHHIIDAAILKGVVYLTERLPSYAHLYIASRTPPSLSLSRLRASNGMNGLEANDLRFDPDETSQFFAKNCGIDLSTRDAAAVQEWTEGWAAAMRLTAISLPEQADSAMLVRMMNATERDISDYFWEEVFSRQPETVQQFLMQTSVLERMTSERCQAVTGIAESEAYLLQLEQNSLFLVPLDERREWYRYHHLFQSFLTKQLRMNEPIRWQEHHSAAGKWLEENGYPEEAIDQYLTAKNYEQALSLLEAMAPELMIKEWATLGAWLAAIPDALLVAKPMMLLTKLAAQYLSGQVEAATAGYWQAVRLLEADEASFPPDASRTLQAGLAFLTAFRTFMDRDFEYAVQYSREYVAKHPEGDFFVGFGSDQDGYQPIWDIYVSDGSLNLADQVVVPLLAIWSGTGNMYFVAHLHIDLGKLQYERNRLDDAKRHMRQAYEIGRQHHNRSLATIASLWLARIAAVQGEREVARVKLKEWGNQALLESNPRLSKKMLLFQATLGKQEGAAKQAYQWLRTSGLRYTDEIPLSMLEEYHLLAVLLVERGQIRSAEALVERLLRIVNESGRQGAQIRLLVARSRILSLQGKVGSSMDVLEEALALAWPEKYIRSFVDEGVPLGQLLDQYIKLRQAQHRRPGKKVPLTYVKRLLQLIYPLQKASNEKASLETYMPSLTTKEQSVLRLMKEGLSNKAMALEMNVSLATIKTHINNIYGKLQSKNRLQALERARTLQLF